VNPGETVLDLGSGGGKLCYIASQVVGAEGKVIGVDCNQEMLGLARQYQSEVAEKIGYSNVDFRCGVIQNLALDLELFETKLGEISDTGIQNILERRRLEQQLEVEQPMIESDSVDCRVLKTGGRAAISDIVSDEDVPAHMQDNPELWSGCISGAWREDEFMAEFERAGFSGLEVVKRESEPWQTVEGIEFRSVTVVAHKGTVGPCLERNQAVIYKGPFKQVVDDDGAVYERGQTMAVCDKTFNTLKGAPYQDLFYPIELGATKQSKLRTARQTKGADYNETSCCETDGDSCC